MLTAEENERLTRVGQDTPMGKLLRRYWYPIAGTPELDEEPVKAVKILGESLVLYRDRGGRLGLIDELCPHRRASMMYGIPEKEGLRCAYHGWLYNAKGKCLEQPAEDMEGADSKFKDKITTPAYPVQELGGMIFAYLGPEPAPLLPRWDELVKENAIQTVGFAVIPCNWLQIMENSLDPVHVEWLHRYFDNYVLERLGKPELKHPVKHHIKLDFDVFEYGLIKRRVWTGGSVNDVEYRIGHPVLFPNILANVGYQFRVPVDDEHTLHVWYKSKPLPEGVHTEEKTRTKVYDVPVVTAGPGGRAQWSLVDNNSGQDMVMWYTQGPTADRTKEKLGTSDKGIILYRKQLVENLEKMERGEDPMNVFRDPAKNVRLEIPTEKDGGGIAERRLREVGGRKNTGSSTKYDPLDNQEVSELIASPK